MVTAFADYELTAYLRSDRDGVLTARESLIAELTHGLLNEIAPDIAVTSRVKAIALEAAARAIRNENGASSESIDDYSFRRDGSTAAAGVYFTDDERLELLGLAGLVTTRARRSVKLRSSR